MEQTGRDAQRAQTMATWAERIEQQQASGKSIKAYCQEAGVKVWQFSYWRGVLRPKAEAAGFVEVRVKGSGAVTLEVDGCRVRVERGFDAELLREVVAALRTA